MKIFLNAYLNENFGDDLFVQILTHRYHKFQFSILADEAYKADFGENVIYEIDEHFHKMAVKERKILQIFRKIRFPARYVYPKMFRSVYKKTYALAKSSICNIYVIGSGFMEPDKYKYIDYLADVLYYRNKIYLLSSNFGPYKTENYLNKHKKLFELAEDVCFRDSASYNMFSSLHNCRYAMDLVFNYNLGEKYLLPEDYGEYALISVVSPVKDVKSTVNLEKEYISFISECIKHILNLGKKVILVGFCRKQGDDKIIEQLMNEYNDNSYIISFNYPDINYEEMMGLFARASFVIASRYHAMIVGMLYQKLTYVVAYSNKTINVLKDIDGNIYYADVRQLDSVKISEFFDRYGYLISEEKLNELKKSAEFQFLKLDERLAVLKDDSD